MKSSYFLLVFLSGCMLIGSCTSLEKIDLKTEQPLVIMSKGACFGRCPIYEITVYKSGIATFKGERFTEKLGLWIRQLSDTEMRNLNEQLQETNLWQYPSFYSSRLSDAPQITITQFEEDASKSVTGKENRPPSVMELQEFLERMAESSDDKWVVRESFDYGLPAGAVPGEVYVQLAPTVYARNWILRYARQDLRIAEVLPERSNFYRMTFNPQVAFPREIERYLTFDEDVVDFSFLQPKDKE